MCSSEADTLLLTTSSHSLLSMLSFNVATLTFASSDSVDAESKALTSEKQKRFMMAARCPVGGETASDSRRHSGSVWGPARSAGCLLRLKPQWNPSTNPTDGPPLLHQPKHNSLLTTSPSLVELQDESLFQILFFSFFLQGSFVQQPCSQSHLLDHLVNPL